MSNRTFYASTYVVADGVTRTWPFSFAGVNTGQESGVTPYLYPEDVKVQEIFTDEAGNKQTVQRTGVLSAPNQITVDGPAIIAGREIRIYRETELRFPLVDYRDLQSVSEHDLDLANRQAVFIAQETRDTASANLVYDPQGHFNAGDRKIVNLAPGTDSKDAVNMEQHMRSIRVASGSPAIKAVPQLPADRAGKVLTFDAEGNPLAQFPSSHTALELEMQLADPTTGPGKVGFKRTRVAKTTDGTIGRMLAQTSVTPWEWQSLVTSRPDPDDTSTWDWRPAVQAALDFCWAFGDKWIYLHDMFTVTPDPTSPAVANAYAQGSVCCSVKSPVRLWGPGGLRLKAGTAVTAGAVLGNPHVTTIDGQVMVDVEIDGNLSNNPNGTMSGILLIGVLNPVFRSDCYVHDVSNHGIMCRPNPSQMGMTQTSMEVHGATVNICGGIGIQGTRVKDFWMTSAKVSNCGDNLVDVYGNDPAGGASVGFVGKAIVNGLFGKEGAIGVFIESFSDWSITNFDLTSCRGIKCNRINSGALDGGIKHGRLEGDADGRTPYGVSINNSSGFTHIDDVKFINLVDSVTCGGGTDRIRMGSRNTHRGIQRYIVNHTRAASQLVKSTIEDQYITEEALSTTGWPQLTPPMSSPSWAGSQFNVFRGTLRSVAGNKNLGVDFEVASTKLTSPGSWGGAYSLYNSLSDGETRINTDPDIATLPTYVTVSGVAYYVVPSGVAGEYYIRRWDGSTAVAGDYTTALNSALTVSVKYPAFATA